MNRYKIDYNEYSSADYPFALYCKRGWFGGWNHISSFKTKGEAASRAEMLQGLPIYIRQVAAS